MSVLVAITVYLAGEAGQVGQFTGTRHHIRGSGGRERETSIAPAVRERDKEVGDISYNLMM